jgi:hypothetical protein
VRRDLLKGSFDNADSRSKDYLSAMCCLESLRSGEFDAPGSSTGSAADTIATIAAQDGSAASPTLELES